MCLPLLGLGVAGAVALVAWAQEVEVTLDQVPEAVKATILCESAGGRITEIERETKNDVTVWRAIVLQRGGSIAAQAEEGESRIAMRLPGGG